MLTHVLNLLFRRRNEPYVAEPRYHVTQPGDNRHREHPNWRRCECPTCRVKHARYGRRQAGTVKPFQRRA